MWTERKNDSGQWVAGNSSRASNTATPKAKSKNAMPPLPPRPLTPGRVDRVSASPLRVPLEMAIERCLQEKSMQRSKSRRLNRSSRREDLGNSSFLRRTRLYDTSLQETKRAHTETLSFIKKHFGQETMIPVQTFIERVIQDYEDLWGNQNVERMMESFAYKVTDIFGVEGVDARQLIAKTAENGMIGLIVQIFRAINEEETYKASNYTTFSRNPQIMSINRSFEQQLGECSNILNIKNVVQQFMETMYQSMESQIYGKFNVEMRRMVLKYRDAERMLKKVNEKLIHHADIFELERKMKAKEKDAQEQLQELKKKHEHLEECFRRERDSNADLKTTKTRLEDQNQKLKVNVEKFQAILINKFESQKENDPCNFTPTSRRLNSSVLPDRTLDTTNLTNKDPQPFQIKIDTHFIQRQLGPPVAQTTTTFLQPQPPFTTTHTPLYQPYLAQFPNPPNINFTSSTGPSYSPIKLQNDILESRPSYQSNRPSSRHGEQSYSPYHSRRAP